MGHPETKLLTKQKRIILLNLLSFANCLLGDNVFHKWEFSSSGTIMYYVREQGWELLKILVELRQVHPINTPATLAVASDSWSHGFVCGFQIPSFLQLASSVLMQEKASSVGTPEPLGKSTGGAVAGHVAWVADFLLIKPNLCWTTAFCLCWGDKWDQSGALLHLDK